MPTHGDFSIGSQNWPGTAKLVEEMGELQQVLGKLIAIGGETRHWSGDLRQKLVEEIGDVHAALSFFEQHNMTQTERRAITVRAVTKMDTFCVWQKNPPPIPDE